MVTECFVVLYLLGKPILGPGFSFYRFRQGANVLEICPAACPDSGVFPPTPYVYHVGSLCDGWGR